VETITMLRPGAELVAEARISLGTDPYLADYLIDGRAVLPAAMGLEAMAQAASMLARQPLRRAHGVSLGIPMAVAGSEQAVLRVQARVRGDGAQVETVLRRRSGGRLTEYARAVFVGPGESREEAGYPACPVAEPGDARAGSGLVPGAMVPFGAAPVADEPGTADEPGLVGGAGVVDGADLYGAVCFQTGRFRRVALVCRTRPGAYRAIVRGADELPWFGHLPSSAGTLILGSPGLNDAALQVVQACVPHRRLLPAGCDAFTVSGTQVPGAVELHAFLRAAPGGAAMGERPAGRDQNGTPTLGSGGGTSAPQNENEPPAPGDENGTPARWDEYVWDIHGYDATGQPVVTWLGLRMQDAGPLYPGRSEAHARRLSSATGILSPNIRRI
jgi:enediyne polyketide synthase